MSGAPREACWRVPVVARGVMSRYFSDGKLGYGRVDKQINLHLYAPIISAVDSLEALEKVHALFPEALAAEPQKTCEPGIHVRGNQATFRRSDLDRIGFH